MKSKKVDLISFDDNLNEPVINLPRTVVSQVYNDSKQEYLEDTLSDLDILSSKVATINDLGIVRLDSDYFYINTNGTISFNGEIPKQYPDVSNLILTQSEDGSLVTVSFVKPTDNEYLIFLRTEIFYSTENIENLSYEALSEDSYVNYIDSGDSEEVSFDSDVDTTYYVKVFTTYHDTDEQQDIVTEGVSANIVTQDTRSVPMITNFEAEYMNGVINLTWTNPSQNNFNNVKILYKVNSLPQSETDGTMLYNGSDTSVTLEDVIEGETYYFRAFTYNKTNIINDSLTGSTIEVKALKIEIYKLTINELDSNPSTSVSYIGDNVDFTPASNTDGNFNIGSWGDKFPYNQIKPFAISHDMNEFIELDPNDFNKKINGEPIDISENGIYNVMIRFPKIYWKINKLMDTVTVEMSNYQVDSTYKAKAHKFGFNQFDYVYISAYMGKVNDLGTGVNFLKSQTGGLPDRQDYINSKIGVRNNRYNGNETMEITNFYQYQMLQILYLFLFKNLDSQSTFALGAVNVNTSYRPVRGNASTKGMYYGSPTSVSDSFKLFGIEDLYGNTEKWVEGLRLFTPSSGVVNIGIKDSDYDSETGWSIRQLIYTSPSTDYLTGVIGGDYGFLGDTFDGSSSTYYTDVCDYGSLEVNRYGSFGGSNSAGREGGIFNMEIKTEITDNTLGTLFTLYENK